MSFGTAISVRLGGHGRAAWGWAGWTRALGNLLPTYLVKCIQVGMDGLGRVRDNGRWGSSASMADLCRHARDQAVSAQPPRSRCCRASPVEIQDVLPNQLWRNTMFETNAAHRIII